MREEERARRRVSKAQKEAAKEEDLIRKAMEKARADVEKATDEERARFQQKLSDLSERLRRRRGEEPTLPALSMAQQDEDQQCLRDLEHPILRRGRLQDRDDPAPFTAGSRLRAWQRQCPLRVRRARHDPQRRRPGPGHALHQRFARNRTGQSAKKFFRVPLRRDPRGRAPGHRHRVDARRRGAPGSARRKATERTLANKTINEAAWLEQQAKADTAVVDEEDLAEAVA